MLTPPSTFGEGPLFELGALDSITVKKNVALVSTSGHVINAVGSDHTAIVHGTVVAQFFGIVLGASSSTYSGNTVIVAESGRIMGLGPSGGAIGCYGFAANITNHGFVEGELYGVGLYGDSTTTHSTVINTGTITAGARGIYRDGVVTTETIVLKNSGMIESAGAAYGSTGGDGHTGRDLITNTGRMIGDVTMADGDDKYDGRKGRIEGDVFGGGDADILMGGKEANRFFGDAGMDKLVGGIGADTLTGGADADQFIYKSTKESSVKPSGQDVIIDFTQGQSDRINLKAIDADARDGGNQKFEFVGDSAFHGHAGELRFKIVLDDTFIYVDTNGDKKADFSIRLDTAVGLTADDFIL